MSHKTKCEKYVFRYLHSEWKPTQGDFWLLSKDTWWTLTSTSNTTWIVCFARFSFNDFIQCLTILRISFGYSCTFVSCLYVICVCHFISSVNCTVKVTFDICKWNDHNFKKYCFQTFTPFATDFNYVDC